MTIGIIGHKRGMTRVFTEEGQSVPVTVIEVEPNRVTSLTDPDQRGYRAVQVAWGRKKQGKASKSQAGEFAKANIDAGEGLAEFRLQEGEGADFKPGYEIKVNIFEAGQKVDVSGTTIGKGFSGAIKRHNFRMGNATHGNSLSHRSAGSNGQCQFPGRVFKGKKMAGQMGNVNRTAQNLEVIKVDDERNLILIKGAVPGSKNGKVIVKPSVKKRAGGK